MIDPHVLSGPILLQNSFVCDTTSTRHGPTSCVIIAFAALLSISSCSSQAATGHDLVVCKITKLELDFSDLRPLEFGLQQGEGYVEVHCINTSERSQTVNLLVVDSNASPHQLESGRPAEKPLSITFFADSTRTEKLSSSTTPAVLHVHGNSSHSQKIPLYASFPITAVVPAGTYSGVIGLKLIQQLQP